MWKWTWRLWESSGFPIETQRSMPFGGVGNGKKNTDNLTYYRISQATPSQKKTLSKTGYAGKRQLLPGLPLIVGQVTSNIRQALVTRKVKNNYWTTVQTIITKYHFQVRPCSTHTPVVNPIGETISPVQGMMIPLTTQRLRVRVPNIAKRDTRDTSLSLCVGFVVLYVILFENLIPSIPSMSISCHHVLHFVKPLPRSKSRLKWVKTDRCC